MARPTDPDQLALSLAEIALSLRQREAGADLDGAIAHDCARELARLSYLLSLEAQRSPAERIRELASRHVGTTPAVHGFAGLVPLPVIAAATHAHGLLPGLAAVAVPLVFGGLPALAALVRGRGR